jgi:hypothetical protein
MEAGADGVTALMRFATGMDLVGEAHPNITCVREAGSHPPAMLVSFRRRLAADEAAVELQISSELGSWQSLRPAAAGAPVVNRSSEAAGTETIVLRIPAEAPKFLRLRVSVP